MGKPAFNVLHVTSWLSRNGGGIPPVIWSLAREQMKLGLHCQVAGLKDEYVDADCAKQRVPWKAGAIVGPSALGYSPELAKLAKLASDAGSSGSGVVHGHGLWMYPGLAAYKTARTAKCPLIISPHGMLEPWALNNSRWKKRIVALLFENRNLRFAHCLHALNPAEAESIRHYGVKNPVAIIPNGVDIEGIHPLPDRDALARHFPQIKGKRRVLFLSRLHPKKGLSNLLRAWSNLVREFPDWTLLIAGSGAPDYERELRELTASIAIEQSVVFLGAVYGEQKREALAAADLFVLPSFSEGLSMATLEAAAAGLPVLHTPECNFPQLTKAGAAIETTATESGVESGLRALLKLSPETRHEMGQKGLAMVKSNYTWRQVATQMLALYQWLRNEGPIPLFVRLN